MTNTTEMKLSLNEEWWNEYPYHMGELRHIEEGETNTFNHNCPGCNQACYSLGKGWCDYDQLYGGIKTLDSTELFRRTTLTCTGDEQGFTLW